MGVNTAPGKTEQHLVRCAWSLGKRTWASLLPLGYCSVRLTAVHSGTGFLMVSKGRSSEFRGNGTGPPSLHPVKPFKVTFMSTVPVGVQYWLFSLPSWRAGQDVSRASPGFPCFC